MFKADPSDNIKVVVRIRPVNQRETDENGAECIFDLENQNELEQFQEQENEQDQQQFQEQEKKEIQEKQLDQEIFQQNEIICSKQKNIQQYQKSFYFGTQDDHKQYSFDYVAKQDSTQNEIYQIIGVPLSEFALDGYNICIFAYGQTGTGKTHTMYGKIGDTEQEGLQTRILKKIFSEINKNQQPGKQTLCYCNYFEIYNENIIDLLAEDIDKGVQVQIREDVKKGVFVENLQNKYITSYEEGMEILNEGNQSRHVAATKMNLESSRSHSIFQFHIQQKISKNGITNFKDSKINFVDLAGSERQKQTHATGERLKEATNINRSLSILGRVINSLVEKQKKKNIHIPYRDSKLTFILKDSLGGNAKTVMIATITASDLAYQETLSTIKFAQRAKQITNQAQKNEETSGSLALLQKEIKILKRQIDDYKQKVMLYESGNFQIGSQNYKQQNESELVENSEINDMKVQNLNQQKDQNMQNERLDTEEKENLNSLQFSQNLDQKLVDEMKMLKDQLAVKEHELNINEIKYQELEFDLNHQKERNKILEKQNKELQNQLDEQQDELNNQIQELEEENESNKEIIEQFQQTREKEESTNEHLSLQPKSTIKSKAQSMLKSKLEGAVQKSAMIGVDQETEKLRAENQFLNEKLEKFYMLQDKFLNQSSMKEQQQMINNSKLRVKEEDKVLDLISVNDNLLKQIQQFKEENEELKNEINKLNEDNDTLKETVFYISTQLNQKRKQEKLLAQSIQMQHQNQSSLDFTPRSREVSELANSQNFRKQQSIQQSIKDFSKKQEQMHNFDFFQYYSDFKYQILLENLDDVENFLKDSYAQVHQDFTVYIFFVWSNLQNLDDFLLKFPDLCLKLQNQQEIIMNLMGNQLDDGQFKEIINGIKLFKNLQKLDFNFSHNKISNQGLNDFAEILLKFNKLENLSLNFQYNSLLDYSCSKEIVSNLKKLENLKEIKIITDGKGIQNQEMNKGYGSLGKIADFYGFKIDTSNKLDQSSANFYGQQINLGESKSSNYDNSIQEIMNKQLYQTPEQKNQNKQNSDSSPISKYQKDTPLQKSKIKNENQGKARKNSKNKKQIKEEEMCKVCIIF